MNRINRIVCAGCGLFLLAACQSDDEPGRGGGTPSSNKKVNEWIDGIMRDHYLWYEDLPEQEILNYEAAPEAFFGSLLSDKDGKTLSGGRHYFSTIARTAGSKALPPTDGTDTYGIDYMPYLFTSSAAYYYLRVNYVLPASPAAEAGIRRGDWIVERNGAPLRQPYGLSAGGAVELTLARLNADGELYRTGVVSLPSACPVENPPFLLDTVYTTGRGRVAYLVYTHFSSGRDGYKDTRYDARMKTIFSRFKAEGATECILDLRYNGGGLVSSARLLASLLAPASALNDVFCVERFNDKQNPRTNTLNMLDEASVRQSNLNLHRLYVVTSEQTASASELVINALRPYMGAENVILIGTQTLGKNVGSFTYGLDDNYGYTISPIAFYVLNKAGSGDYENGFVPDIVYDEYENYSTDFRPLGDTDEPLLQIALTEITGSRSAVAGNAAVRTRTGNRLAPARGFAPARPFAGGVLLDDTNLQEKGSNE